MQEDLVNLDPTIETAELHPGEISLVLFSSFPLSNFALAVYLRRIAPQDFIRG